MPSSKLLLSCVFFFCHYILQAQELSLSGYVQDSLSGERLVGATLHLLEKNQFVITNEFGFFSVQIAPSEPQSIALSYLGYEKRLIRQAVSGDTTLVYKLKPASNYLETVEVKVSKYLPPPKTEGTIIQLFPEEIKQLPKLLGETDALKAFQLMPGVQGGAEGSSALHIRGGSPDQNLILLEDMPLYFANHLGGFLSVIDANAINSVRLYKGGYPARFAGRLSAVLDVRLKDGSLQNWEKNISLGVLSSKCNFSGPLIKDKLSLALTLRRSNLDLITQISALLNPKDEFSAGFYFYDGSLKLTYTLSDKDRINVSFYAGEDRLFIRQREKDEFQGQPYELNTRVRNNWGNRSFALRWNHLYAPHFFANYVLSFSGFNYFNGQTSNLSYVDEPELLPQISTFDLSSAINDWSLRLNHEWHGSAVYRFGLVANQLRIRQPGIYYFQQLDGGQVIEEQDGAQVRNSQSIGAFVEFEPKLAGGFSLNAGLHTGFFFIENRVFPSLQPRMVLNYAFSNPLSVNFTYSRMVQNLHLLSNSGAGLPTDLWLPATSRIRPASSDQLSIGGQWLTEHVVLEVDVFHKWLQHQIEFQQGASFFSGGSDWQQKVVSDGVGRAYGVEFLLRRKAQKFNGWIAYTWSKNTRTFAQLSRGEPFPYKYDRPHVLDIVCIWSPNPRFSMSLTWTYESGHAITLPDARYELEALDIDPSIPGYNIEFGPHEAQLYLKRNNYRMPDYHRLDVNFNFLKTYQVRGKERQRTLSCGMYNLYNRHNPYFIFYDENSQGKTSLFQFALFPILPYVSYELAF